MSARGLVAPYRPGTVGGIALGTALIAIGISARLWTGAVGAFDLRDVIFACRNALPALALPVGWLAVWAASVHTSDSAIIGAAPGRPRNQIVPRQAGVLAAATTLGWLAGWAVPGGIAFATQYWSRSICSGSPSSRSPRGRWPRSVWPSPCSATSGRAPW